MPYPASDLYPQSALYPGGYAMYVLPPSGLYPRTLRFHRDGEREIVVLTNDEFQVSDLGDAQILIESFGFAEA